MFVPHLRQPQELERLVEDLWGAPRASHVGLAIFDSVVVREFIVREVRQSSLPYAVRSLVLSPTADLGGKLAELAKVPAAIVFLSRSEVSSEQFGRKGFWPRVTAALERPELAAHRFIHWVTLAQFLGRGEPPRPALLPFGTYDFQVSDRQEARNLRQASLLDSQALMRLDVKHAQPFYAALLDEAQADRDAPPAQTGYAQLRLAQVALRACDVSSCEQHLASAEQVAVKAEDDALYAWVMAQRGLSAATAGDYAAAWRHYTTALHGFEVEGNSASQAWTMGRMGQLLLVQADPEGARAHLETALVLNQSTGDIAECASTEKLLGDACTAAGELEGALEHFDQALFAFVGLRREMEQAGALRSAAWALLRGGHFDQARDYLDRAQALADRHDDPRAVADTHSLRGALHFQMEEWQAASVAYWHSLAGYEPIHDRLGIATAHLGLGKSFYALGEFPRALPHIEEALKLFRGLKLDRDTARAEALVVQVRRVLGSNAPAPEARVEVIDPYTTLQADVPRAAPPARPAGRARP